MSVTEREDGGIETGQQTGSGLDENVAAALSYLFGAVTGVIFFVLDKENSFVRFHAAQSIVLSIAVLVTYLGVSIVSSILLSISFFGGGGLGLAGLLGLLWLLLSLAVFVLWLVLLLRTYQGATIRLPVIADLADRIA